MDTTTDKCLDTMRLVCNVIEENRLGYVGLHVDGNEQRVTVHVWAPLWPKWRDALTFTGRHHSTEGVKVGDEKRTRYEFTAEIAGHEFIVLTYLEGEHEVGDLR